MSTTTATPTRATTGQLGMTGKAKLPAAAGDDDHGRARMWAADSSPVA
jgi:hypothetical protein